MAILITASYSINDTVVVFDRVRENKGRYGSMPMGALLNLSVNETLSRLAHVAHHAGGAFVIFFRWACDCGLACRFWWVLWWEPIPPFVGIAPFVVADPIL